VRIVGIAGEVRYGYRRVATLHGGTIARKQTLDDVTTLGATCRVVNTFGWTQRPLDVWLAIGPDWWVWRAVTFEIDGFHCSCELPGEPEFRPRGSTSCV
jgi:hypothetical protein